MVDPQRLVFEKQVSSPWKRWTGWDSPTLLGTKMDAFRSEYISNPT